MLVILILVAILAVFRFGASTAYLIVRLVSGGLKMSSYHELQS